jgi:hypothetical protein
VAVLDGASASASAMAMEPLATPTVDCSWLDQDERVSPTRPQSSQDQPQQTVRCAKPSIRTGEYAQLMAQGQDLEQQVSTRRRGESECRDRLTAVTHHA